MCLHSRIAMITCIAVRMETERVFTGGLRLIEAVYGLIYYYAH
jgi:hypothetical protein